MKIKLNPNRWLIVLISVVTLLVLAACSSSPATSTTTTTTSAPPTTTTTSPTTTVSTTPSPTGTTVPAIVITSPGSGNQFGIGKTTIAVQVANFSLVNKLGQPNTAGEGHIHYFMDVDPPTTPGQPAVTTPGTYVATADASYTWANVGGGQHKFSVELVNNDHTPLNPPVSQSISMLVIPEIGPPQAVILSPRDNAVINGNSITVEVQAANFNVVDKLGQANSPREGHIHYFIDVDAPTTAGQPAVTAQGTYAASPDASYTWQNVSSGMHSLSIELVNNDHSPLDPPVVSKIMVMVVGPAISPSPTATATPTPTATGTATPTGSGQAITIDLSAQNIAFDKATISVTAGANVTVNFNNKDAGIPHNFAVYQTLAGGQTKPIFVGNAITGPATTTYHFTAPTAAGTYFFECDIHPNVMNGTFVINGP